MTTDSYIQVAADGSGKKVRNVLGTVVLADGSEHAVYMQATAQIGPDGKLVSNDTTYLLDSINEMRDLLTDILAVLTEGFEVDTRQANAKKGGRSFSTITRERG